MDLANEMTGEKNVTRLGAAIAKHAWQVVKRRVPHDEIKDNQTLSLVDEAPSPEISRCECKQFHITKPRTNRYRDHKSFSHALRGRLALVGLSALCLNNDNIVGFCLPNSRAIEKSLASKKYDLLC